jgi:selenocysteine lyase/cysteine desulfurase
MDNPPARQLNASDVQQRVRSIGGEEVILDRDGFLWRPEDWTEEVAAGLTADRVYCADDLSRHVALLTANVQGLNPEDAGDILDGDFGIAARTGLHCAPLVHESLGTSPRGSVRFSFGPFNTEEHVDRAVTATCEIARARC